MTKSGLFFVKRKTVVLENESLSLKYLIMKMMEKENVRNKKIDLIYSDFSKIFENLKEKYTTLINLSIELEKILMLPIKYRNSICISRMLDILKDGRALNWEELVNLYENTKYTGNVTSSSDLLYNTLRNLNDTLLNGFPLLNENLSSINTNICTLSSQVNELFAGADNVKEIIEVIYFNHVLNN
jgi:hypothetical protein